jgi:uncharacterized protein DUF2785
MPALAMAAVLLAAAHPIDFWRGIVQQKYAPPEDADVVALAGELSELLSSPNPELRDEIAYSTLTAWIYQKQILDGESVRRLTDVWLHNLEAGIGERGTDTVFRRSFSALMLSVVVARDNAKPFLTEDDIRRIETAALKYFEAERDVRGYDPEKGWVHSVAHTADLLKFVARNRHLEPAGQPRLLEAIAKKLTTAPVVFFNGEDERIARAVLSVINRSDFDRAGFAAWVSRTKPSRLTSARPKVEDLRAGQNITNLFAKLEVLLSVDLLPSDSVQAARESVRAALKDLF